MLYGADTLVLFYQKFVTTYNYSKIGRIENPAGLQSLLGSGTALIKFNVL